MSRSLPLKNIYDPDNGQEHHENEVVRNQPATLSDPASLGTVLLTIREACKLLRISKQLFYAKFIWTRRLKTFKIGRRRVMRASQLQNLVEELEDEESTP